MKLFVDCGVRRGIRPELERLLRVSRRAEGGGLRLREILVTVLPSSEVNAFDNDIRR